MNFCWLCLRRIDSLNGLGHYSSVGGCTLFGAKRWSSRKLLAAQLLLPVTLPLVAAGAAVLGAAVIVCVPVALGRDELRRRGSRLGRLVM